MSIIVAESPASESITAPAPTAPAAETAKPKRTRKPKAPSPTPQVSPTPVPAPAGGTTFEGAARILAALTADGVKALANGTDRAAANNVRAALRLFWRTLCAPAKQGGGSAVFGQSFRLALCRITGKARLADADILANVGNVTAAQVQAEILDSVSVSGIAAAMIADGFAIGIKGAMLALSLDGGRIVLADGEAIRPEWAIPALVMGRAISGSKIRRAM